MIPFLLTNWKQIAIGLTVIALALFARHAWTQHYKDGYNEGVRITENAQAEVIAKVRLENEKHEAELKAFAYRQQVELEGKFNASEIVANNLRDQLRTRRVCTDDEIRPSSGSSDPSAAGKSDGSAGDAGPAETVGDRLAEIGQACQDNTDKLIVLQGYVREVQAKFQ